MVKHAQPTIDHSIMVVYMTHLRIIPYIRVQDVNKGQVVILGEEYDLHASFPKNKQARNDKYMNP
jgi:hypothetical protein